MVSLAVGSDPLAGADATDTQGWIEYQYRRRVNEGLRSSWGLGYRELLSTEDLELEWSRLHLRGDLVYSHSRYLNLEAGLGLYHTFGEPRRDLFELRTWQGAILKWPEFSLPRRRIRFRQRLRLEQRWLNESGQRTGDFGTRLRYRLSTGIPLNDPTIEAKTYYLPLAAELFNDIGDDTPEFFAARARLTTGLGYVLGDNWSLEFRYTLQKARDTTVNRFSTTDHIFDLRIRTTLRIRNLSTPW